MSAPDFIAVLSEHEVAQSEGDYVYCLGCEFKGWIEAHRSHVAAVLSAAVAEWLRSEAEAETYDNHTTYGALSALAATVEP